MRSINSVVVSGRLGKDPAIRSTPSGTELMELTVAVQDNIKQGEQWVKKTHWVKCTLFGRSVAFWSGNLRKGSFVVVQGTLDYREWEKDGVRRSALSVLIDEIDPGPRVDGNAAPAKQRETYHLDDDIPF